MKQFISFLFSISIFVSSSAFSSVASPNSRHLAVDKNLEFLPPASAEVSGGISEGGGKGVVCRNKKSSRIASVELLDLYEAQYQWGLEIKRTNEPVDQQVRRAISKLKNSGFLDNITFNTTQVRSSLRMLPTGAKLKEIDDALNAVIPACPIEQLANYYNANSVLINGDMWKLMSNTDRAALIVHEAVYRFDRETGAKDSRRARHIVGELFSDRNVFTENPIPPQPKAGGYCSSEVFHERDMRSTSFFYAPNGNGYTLTFDRVNGERKLTPTTAAIRVAPDDILNIETETKGLFEGGDIIHIQRETIGAGTANVGEGFFLDGFSGWLPNEKFEKRQLSCVSNDAPHAMTLEVSPDPAIIQPGPLFSCSDLRVSQQTGRQPEPSVYGAAVEFPHAKLKLISDENVELFSVKITIENSGIVGGSHTTELSLDEIEALFGTRELTGPTEVSSDVAKPGGIPACGLTFGNITIAGLGHDAKSFTADVKIEVLGRSKMRSGIGYAYVQAVTNAKASVIIR